MSAIWLRKRLELKRQLISILMIALIAPLFTSIAIPTLATDFAQAVNTTKTWTVLSSNGVPYAGAQAAIYYFNKGESAEKLTTVATSNSSGQFSLTYPDDADYLVLVVQPPASDATQAIFNRDLLSDANASSGTIQLQQSAIQAKIVKPDGTNASSNACFSSPNSATNTRVTNHFRTIRTGSFGIPLPSNLSTSKNYKISVYPCDPSEYNFVQGEIGIRKNVGGSYSLFSDLTYTTSLLAVSGVYPLSYRNSPISGQLVDGSGNAFTFSIDQASYGVDMIPLLSNNDIDNSRDWGWGNVSTTGKFMIDLNNFQVKPGKYAIAFQPWGKVEMTAFRGGYVWVNESGQYASSASGTYSSSLTLSYTIPSSGLAKFKVLDPQGLATTGGNLQIRFKSSTDTFEYWGSVGLPSSGTAAIKLPDGVYEISPNPANAYGLGKKYIYTVTSGTGVLKDALNQTVTTTAGYYELATKTPNLNVKIVSPIDTSVVLSAADISIYPIDDIGNSDAYSYIETSTTPATFSMQNGEFEISISGNGEFAGNVFNLVMTSGSPTVKIGNQVISPVNGIYYLPLKRAAIKGVVKDPTGATVAYTMVNVFSVNQSWPISRSRTDASGKFIIDLGANNGDGTYILQAAPRSGQTIYANSAKVPFVVAGGQGPTDALLTLRTSNVVGTISGPLGASPDNSFTVEKLVSSEWVTEGGGKGYSENFQSNSDGNIGVFLPEGRYRFRADSDLANAGGTAAYSEECVVSSDASTIVTCNITLATPNVTGAITINGIEPSWVNVGLVPSQSIDNNSANETIWSGSSGDGAFGATAPPGLYRLWINFATNRGTNTTIPGPLCNVIANSTQVCNAALPSNNLNFTISNFSGAVQSSGVFAGIQVKEGANYLWTCCTQPDGTGKFSVPLLNGSYRLQVMGDEGVGGIAQNYLFDVETGTVKNMKLEGSSTALTPNSGVYGLQLKSPVIAGTVLQPSGSTSVSNVQLVATVKISGPKGLETRNFWAYTDSSGKYAFDLGVNVIDGSYSVQALAPAGKITMANSIPILVNVVGGVGNSNLNIRLSVPNVTGTITVPVGTYSNSGINIQKLNTSGEWEWVENGWNTTDSTGKFAYSLGIGSYRLYAEPDFAKFGGSATYGSICSVVDTSTAVTCNLTVGQPNMSGTFTIDGISPKSGYIYFQPASGVANNTAQNWAYSSLGSSGKFGSNIRPGTYRMTANFSTNSGWKSIVGTTCVVPSSGSVTCNFTLPATNFKFKILDPSGSDISKLTRAGVMIASEANYLGSGCCVEANSISGLYEYSLVDGAYVVRTFSGSNQVSAIGQLYTFDVVNGSITNLKIDGSSSLLTAAAGVYSLAMRSPPLAGTVYKPNGVTPQSNALIRVYFPTANGTRQWNTWSDANGKFVVDFGAEATDGVYSLSAILNDREETTTAQSVTKFETITAGVGSTTITLNLRTPNFKGKVSGVKGASPNNYVNIQKRDSFGNWNWFEDKGRNTASDGAFSFYLESGTYRVRANGDMTTAGGGEGYSDACVVVVESATVTTCNVTLPPPNASGTVTIGGSVPSPSNVQLMPDYGVENNKANNWFYSSVSSNGSWGVTATPGTYRTMIYSYRQGVNATVPGPQCIVPESGNVSCLIILPATNLEFKVKDVSGTVLVNNVWANVRIKSGDRFVASGGINPDNSSATGRFAASLIDGTYSLTISPSDGGSSRGATNTFNFIVESGTVKNFINSTSLESVSATAGVYLLSLRAPAFSGVVYSTDGTTPVADAHVTAKLISSASRLNEIRASGINDSWGSSTNSAGQFALDFSGNLADGVYEIQATAQSNTLALGSSRIESFTVTNGFASSTISLSLRAPNVSGVVSGIKGTSPNNWISVRKLIENGNYEYLSIARSTDSQGRFAFSLEPGSYHFTAQSDLVNAGGTSVSNSMCVVPSSGNKTCDIYLPAPNLSGTISVGGVATAGSIEFLRETTYGFEYAGLYSGTSNDGVFAITAPAGTYRARVYIYAQNSWFYGPRCVVPTSGSVSCNAVLPAANLSVKILDKDSNIMTSGVSIYSEALYSNGNLGSCCAYIKDPNNPVIKFGFIDGNYRLNIWPDSTKSGTAVNYVLEVESGTVKSLKKSGTDSSLTPTAGIYSLALGAPTISGTVVANDGTTPVPSTSVTAYKDGVVCMWCEYQNSYTDKTGYYGFNALPDGTYQLIARAPETDSTKGDSSPTSITVSGGLGASNVKLTLQNPTVRGTVRGVKGVSPNNYIYVRVIDANGGNRWPDYVRNKPSSGDGTFAFNLPPGTYQFEAQSDLQNAGGTSSRSSNCVVVDTSTVITCDINLSTPNLKIRIVKPDMTDFVNKDVSSYIYYNGGGQLKNNSPQLSLDTEGNFQTNLEDGEWTLVARPPYGESLYSEKRYQILINSGVVVSVKNSEGVALSVSSGIYRLPVTGSNVTGQVTFDDNVYKYGSSVTIERLYGDNFGGLSGAWVTGEYGFKVDPGIYRIRVEPYGLPSTQVTQTYSETFTVSESSTSIINVALRAPNLLGHLKTPTGENYRLANAYIRSTSNIKGYSQKYIRLENDGKFGTYLEQGTYQIDFNPYGDQLKNFAPRSYEIVMGASSITSVRDLISNETLTALNGFYSFKVSTSSVKGKVLPPGTSTIGLSNVQVVVAPVGTPDYWRYSTTSDGDGNFGLLVPDGTYVIRAIPYNGQYQYGKSESQTVIVSGGTTASPIELRLRAPNLTGRIVTPGASPAALANVNINAWIDGEYFYGWTDNSGAFGFYVEKASPQCPARCEIQLNYYKSSEYTPKTYRISSVGAQGDLAIGGITTRLTVLVPQSGSTTVANSYGWVSVESIDTVTSNSSYVTGGQTDELGKVGLSLTDGLTYRITAYPGYKVNGKFAQKVLTVNNYSSANHAALSMTFDRPNFLVRVTGSTGVMNSYGWTRVTKYESATATYNFHSNVYLDDKGETAYTFADGTYQIVFRPGKTVGSQRTATISVAGGVATCTNGCGSVTSGVTAIRLPNGNISGVVTTSSGAAAKSVYVVATMVSDSTKTVTAITSESGLYEIYLDTTYAWTIGAVDPGSGEKGSTSLSATPGNSNSVATDKNFAMAP